MSKKGYKLLGFIGSKTRDKYALDYWEAKVWKRPDGALVLIGEGGPASPFRKPVKGDPGWYKAGKKTIVVPPGEPIPAR